MKKLALGLLIIAVAVIAFFILKPDSNITEPGVVPVVNTQAQTGTTPPPVSPEPVVALDCANPSPFNYAYRVTASTQASAAGQTLYSSELTFNTQIQQMAGDDFKAIASDIIIDENGQTNNIIDTAYIGQMTHTPAEFYHVDLLGLAEKHPMHILSQWVKALSIGAQEKPYQYTYDQLNRTYTYRLNTKGYARTFSDDTTTEPSTWRVELDEQCIPKTIASTETTETPMLTGKVTLAFNIKAERIDNFTDLSQIALNSDFNTNNTWHAAQVNAKLLAKPIKSMEELLALLASQANADQVNSAKLAKGADFILDNLSPNDLANMMAGNDLNEDEKRLLAYSMSLSDKANMEGFVINTISAIPKQKGDQMDMQKVRMMVSLTSHTGITSESYDAMNRLIQDNEESANVQNNALINLGTVVRSLKNGEQHIDYSNDFEQETYNRIKSSNNPKTAILAAGNANLSSDRLDQIILKELNSPIEGTRYAAASTLANKEKNHTLLIDHLTREPSTLVFNVILNKISADKLSESNLSKLRNFQATLPVDSTKYKIISAYTKT